MNRAAFWLTSSSRWSFIGGIPLMLVVNERVPMAQHQRFGPSMTVPVLIENIGLPP